MVRDIAYISQNGRLVWIFQKILNFLRLYCFYLSIYIIFFILSFLYHFVQAVNEISKASRSESRRLPSVAESFNAHVMVNVSSTQDREESTSITMPGNSLSVLFINFVFLFRHLTFLYLAFYTTAHYYWLNQAPNFVDIFPVLIKIFQLNQGVLAC